MTEKNRWNILAFIEQPLFLAAVSFMVGIVGLVFYTPVLVVSGVFILLALHQSHIVSGKHLLVQFVAYASIGCVVVFAFWGIKVALAGQSRRAAVEIANLVSEKIKAPIRERQVSEPHEVNGELDRTARKTTHEVSKSHPETPSTVPQIREKVRPPVDLGIVPPMSFNSQPTSQPERLPPPTVVTFAQFKADIEQKTKACEERLDAEAPCNGDELSKCSDKKFLEWGKPLLDKVENLSNEFQLDLKITHGYSGDKFIRARNAAGNDAADKYRQCCAADALNYFKELAHRVGGGKENLEFYTWSMQLLSPVKSKDWKSARSEVDFKIMDADFELHDLAQQLDAKIIKQCMNSSFPTK
jgi:hypothetical protein